MTITSILENEQSENLTVEELAKNREFNREAVIQGRINKLRIYIRDNYAALKKAYGDNYVGIVLNRESEDCIIVGSNKNRATLERDMKRNFRYRYRTVVNLENGQRFEIK